MIVAAIGDGGGSGIGTGMRTIGSCSLCRGPVRVPTTWMGTQEPVPTCAHCGAIKEPSFGPVIPMVKPGAPR